MAYDTATGPIHSEWKAELAKKAHEWSEFMLSLLGIASIPCLIFYDSLAGLVGLAYMAPTGTSKIIWILSLVITIITSGLQHVYWKQVATGGLFTGFVEAFENGNWPTVLRSTAFMLLCFGGVFMFWVLDTILDSSFTLVLFPQEGFKVQDIVAVNHPQGWFLWNQGDWLPSMKWSTFTYPASPGYYLWTALNTSICAFGEPIAQYVKVHYTGKIEVRGENENPKQAPVSRAGAEKRPSPQKSHKPEKAVHVDPLMKQFLQWLASFATGKAYDKASKKRRSQKPASPPTSGEEEIQLPKPDFKPVSGYAYNSQNGHHRQPLPFGKVIAGHVLEVMLSETEWGFMLVYDKDSEYMYGVRCDEQGNPVPGVSDENAALKLKFKKDKLYKRVWA